MTESAAPTEQQIDEARASRERQIIERLDRDTRALRAAQEGRLRVNIEEAWTEHKLQNRPIVFAFKGRDYLVPATMPARFGAYYLTHCIARSDDGSLFFEIPEERYLETLRMALGDELAAAILDSEVTFEFIKERVLRPVLVAWGIVFVDQAQPEPEKKTDSTLETSSGAGLS